GFFDCIFFGFEGFADGVEVGGFGVDDELGVPFFHVFGAGFDGIHGGGVEVNCWDHDDAALGELVKNRAGGAERAAVLGEGGADFGCGAVAVVGGGLHDDGGATGAVALVGDLFEGGGAVLA